MLPSLLTVMLTDLSNLELLGLHNVCTHMYRAVDI